MNESALIKLLDAYKSGRLTESAAIDKLKHLPYEDLHIARPDHHRELRQGIPEAVFAEGKTVKEAVTVARALYKKSGRLIVTRASKEVYRALKIKSARYFERSRLIIAGELPKPKGHVMVISAGTSDMPVAEEATVTLEFLGSKTTSVHDAGVAGIHRVLDFKERMKSANAIIVVAGMEGALPSVVGGLTDKPVIAVPVSTGYGTSFKGLTALFAMLNSCVPGVAVMNIDNGFGAACLAHKINSLAQK